MVMWVDLIAFNELVGLKIPLVGGIRLVNGGSREVGGCVGVSDGPVVVLRPACKSFIIHPATEISITFPPTPYQHIHPGMSQGNRDESPQGSSSHYVMPPACLTWRGLWPLC